MIADQGPTRILLGLPITRIKKKTHLVFPKILEILGQSPTASSECDRCINSRQGRLLLHPKCQPSGRRDDDGMNGRMNSDTGHGLPVAKNL
jgi:hypothetical protein